MTPRRRPRVLAALLAAAGLAACGESRVFAPPSLEDRTTWEGIGLWSDTGDTADLDLLRGDVVARPDSLVHTGPLTWRVVSIENVARGVARTWPSVEERWVIVRTEIVNESYPSDTLALDTGRPAPRSVTIVPREAVVLVDDQGNRHAPLRVHDRLRPSIEQSVAVESRPLTVPFLFSLKRLHAPAAIEIHAPLGDGVIRWNDPARPSEWIRLDRKALLQDKSLRALWEITLRRVRFEERGDAGEGRSFLADVLLRNVTRVGEPAPEPSRIRLYTGGGRTLRSVSLPAIAPRIVSPGQAVPLVVRFLDVPENETLELIIPHGRDFARLEAMPGFLPEKPFPMAAPVFSEGLRAVAYGLERTPGTDVRLKVGLTHFGEDELGVGGLNISGWNGNYWIPGVMSGAPALLYPSFEERRWIVFPTPVSQLKLEIPGRDPIIVPL